MTPEQRAWFARFDALTRSSYLALVQPPGGRIRMGPWRVYAFLMHCHRWLWLRGVKL